MAAIVESLAKRFKLSEEDLKELLPSGTSFKFASRVGWARTYLGKALLLEKTGRGVVRITSRGKKVLAQKPASINNILLSDFPEFVTFRNGEKSETPSQPTSNLVATEAKLSPEEELSKIYAELNADLKSEILQAIMVQSPAFFERLVIELLVKMGYGGSFEDAAKVIGKSGDSGLDGIIKEDRLGLDVLYVQAKRWDLDNTVGRKEIQSFVGALAGAGATKGVFVTTSKFSKEALNYKPNNLRVILIDGEELARLMISNGLGVQVRESILIKKVDLDYFNDNLS